MDKTPVKEGTVRCTFEDKILMSDIVFLRAWTRVDIPKFFNPVTSLLQSGDQVWKGMRTVAEIRREQGLPIPVTKDSLYKVLDSAGVGSLTVFFGGKTAGQAR